MDKMPRTYSLTSVEKQVLYKKHIAGGLTSFQANARIRGVKKHLKEVVDKMRMNNKKPEEIQLRFREEFELVCQKLEGEYGVD